MHSRSRMQIPRPFGAGCIHPHTPGHTHTLGKSASHKTAKMSRISLLSSSQRNDLHSAIVAYLQDRVPPDLLDDLCHHLNTPKQADSLEPDKSHNKNILERKWSSIVRLQKKIIDLEAKVSQLSDVIESSPTSMLSTPKSALTWLPSKAHNSSLLGHRAPVTAIAFHPIYSIFVSACEDGTFKVWDWELSDLEKTIKAHTKSITSIDFSPIIEQSTNSYLLATCSSDLYIKIWDSDFNNIRTLMGHDHTISCVKFIPNSQPLQLISCSRDKSIRVWDFQSGWCLKSFIGHSDWVRCIDPSPNGQYVLSCSNDQSARVSHINSGNGLIALLGHTHVIETCSFIPLNSWSYLDKIASSLIPHDSSTIDSNILLPYKYAITGSRDNDLKIWYLPTPSQASRLSSFQGICILTLKGHASWIRGITFHPSGQYILSCSDDKSIKCWDLNQGGRCIRTIDDAHERFITCIKWVNLKPSTTNSNSTNEKLLNGIQSNGNGNSNNNINGVLKNGNNNNNNNKINNNENDLNDDEIRRIQCVVATGSVDSTIKIWR